MIFEHHIGLTTSKKSEKMITRIAVRALILKNDKLLMVSNNKGDIKFPGGGVEPNESYNIAIKREVKEETGYLISNVDSLAGIITERRIDIFDPEKLFEMRSYYYICNVSEEKSKQSLDDYEAELEFIPRWVSINEAIKINLEAVKLSNRNPWVEREIYVLNQLKNNLV